MKITRSKVMMTCESFSSRKFFQRVRSREVSILGYSVPAHSNPHSVRRELPSSCWNMRFCATPKFKIDFNGKRRSPFDSPSNFMRKKRIARTFWRKNIFRWKSLEIAGNRGKSSDTVERRVDLGVFGAREFESAIRLPFLAFYQSKIAFSCEKSGNFGRRYLANYAS